MKMKELGIVGTLGRFKPLHNGHAPFLDSICEKSDHLKICITSSNKYNMRNPFTAQETAGMIDAYLSPKFGNYSFLFAPDFAQIPGCEDGHCWRDYVADVFGKIDYLVSGNPYVKGLLDVRYKILHPFEVVPEEKRVDLKATEVRIEMAKGGDWQKLVPKEVAEYITKNKLDERFRREFGEQTLAAIAGEDYQKIENCDEEKANAMQK